MQSSLKTISLLLLFLLACSTLSLAQSRPSELQRDVRPRSCSISGRVTINGQPANNVQVTFSEFPTNFDQPTPIRQMADGSISRTMFKTRTDADGRYQITNLPPGKYLVQAANRVFVTDELNQPNREPKSVTLDAGESRENLNFSLVRGGVITGQITDAEGRSVIAQSVHLFRVVTGADGQPRIQQAGGDFGERLTDDRGVYRLYGLPAGNYIVGSGGESDFFSIIKYPRVFYPDAPDEKQAKAIPLKAGEEITGINLRLGVTGKRYEALGRIIDAETGQPVPNLRINCEKIYDSTQSEDSYGGGSGQSDRLGNFRLTGLPPGKYKTYLYAGWMELSDYYGEPTTFVISDGDISGVEIKAVRGGVIGGTSVIEGSTDPAVKAQLTQVQLVAYTNRDESQGQTDQPSSHHQMPLKADGSFLVTGVAPGKIRISAHSPRALQLLRIERGGAEIKEFIELAKGEKITDLRLVFSTGSGVIRGQVQAVGGGRLVGASNLINARLIGNTAGRGYTAQVDDKGRFELTNLPNGEYELTLNSFARSDDNGYRMQTLAKQRVTVSGGAEVRVTLTYDPSKPVQEER